MKELERLNRTMFGHGGRIIELKEDIKALRKQLPTKTIVSEGGAHDNAGV